MAPRNPHEGSSAAFAASSPSETSCFLFRMVERRHRERMLAVFSGLRKYALASERLRGAAPASLDAPLTLSSGRAGRLPLVVGRCGAVGIKSGLNGGDGMFNPGLRVSLEGMSIQLLVRCSFLDKPSAAAAQHLDVPVSPWQPGIQQRSLVLWRLSSCQQNATFNKDSPEICGLL
ncbi:hypothetical protein Q8A73_014378 [Channa argus]|nr:hypothetical protein Q8A73_014378 [Channa argus]